MQSYKEAERMKSRGRSHRSVAGDGGAAANVQEEFQSPCSVAEERCCGGGVVDGDAERRRASVSAGSRAATAAMLLFGPAEKRRRQESRRGRRHCGGGKKISLPPPPYLYVSQVGVVGIVGVFHSPDRSCRESPRGGTEWGGGSCNRAMTQ
jgi:hypothetical protein